MTHGTGLIRWEYLETGVDLIMGRLREGVNMETVSAHMNAVFGQG